MLHNCIVEVKVIDINHKVLGAWSQDHAVPMQFGGGEVGCWGGDWSVKCEFFSSHCESHYVRLFLLGPNVADDAAICKLGVLGDFVPVDEKQVLFPCMYPSPWKSCLVSFDIPLLHLIFSGPLIRCCYSWAFIILVHMNLLSLPGSKLSLPYIW